MEEPAQDEEDTQPYEWSPIINTPAPVVARTASTPLRGKKRANSPSSLDASPVIAVSSKENEGSSPVHANNQTNLLSSLDNSNDDTVEIPANVAGLPCYASDNDREQLQTLTGTTNASTTPFVQCAKEAIALKLLYIRLIKELHSLLVCGALSRTEYQTQLDIILGQMATL